MTKASQRTSSFVIRVSSFLIAIMGLFDKLKQGLTKTTQLLNTNVRDLFKAQGRLVERFVSKGRL